MESVLEYVIYSPISCSLAQTSLSEGRSIEDENTLFWASSKLESMSPGILRARQLGQKRPAVTQFPRSNHADAVSSMLHVSQNSLPPPGQTREYHACPRSQSGPTHPGAEPRRRLEVAVDQSSQEEEMAKKGCASVTRCGFPLVSSGILGDQLPSTLT